LKNYAPASIIGVWVNIFETKKSIRPAVQEWFLDGWTEKPA
jgi:hypothetical protein